MLIGITGTFGAGKGSIAEYLAKKHEFIYVSVRAFFAAEVVREGIAVNRASIAQIASEIRAKYGLTYPLEQLLNNTPRARNIVIESIRAVGEVNYLKTRGDALWAVDAEIKTRYQRIKLRGLEIDNISFEQFSAAEQQELHSDNPNLPSLAQAISMANQLINNDGSRDELYAQVDKALTNTQ